MRAFRNDNTDSNSLFGFNVRDFLPSDSDVFLFCDLVLNLDLSMFDGAYSSVGEKPIDPALMLRTILYGLCYGVVSGNKLATACRYDSRFVVLSGDQRPDRRTFDRFFIRHAGAMPDFFQSVVRLAQASGLVGLGRLAIDGTKIKANTSKHKAMSYGYMLKAVETLETELSALREAISSENSEEATMDGRVPKEIARREKRLEAILAAKHRLEDEAHRKNLDKPEDNTQKSFNDLDALPINNKGKEFLYGYNAQAAVDERSQIVTGVTLHDSCNDTHGLASVLRQSIENCQQSPKQVLADAAYGKDAANYSIIEDAGATPVIATGRGESEGRITLADLLEYDAEHDKYLCPAGRVFLNESSSGDGGKEVKLEKEFCGLCPLRAECPFFCKQGRSVKVPPEKHRAARLANAARMNTEEGKADYRRRKAIVEPVFGNIKWNRGFRLYVKGREKVYARILVAFAAHNISKIVKAKMAA